jgi:predicted ATPase
LLKTALMSSVLPDLTDQHLKDLGIALGDRLKMLRPIRELAEAFRRRRALVGREEELELLLRRWSKANSGEGHAVLISGEPGIGKSRLTAALPERLATEPHTCLRYFCSPLHTDSTLYPFISQIERAAGFAHDDTAQAKLGKQDAVLAQSFTPPQDAALFAEML